MIILIKVISTERRLSYKERIIDSRGVNTISSVRKVAVKLWQLNTAR